MMEEHACIDVLSLVQRCASSTDGAVSQAGGLSLEAGASPLVSPQVGSAAVFHRGLGRNGICFLELLKPCATNR